MSKYAVLTICKRDGNLFKMSWTEVIGLCLKCPFCGHRSLRLQGIELWTTIGGVTYQQQQEIFRKAADLKKRGMTDVTIEDMLGRKQ